MEKIEERCILSFKDMMKKEVICICDGKKLGNIISCEIDISNSRICSYLIKERRFDFFFFKKDNIYKVNVRDIKKIGCEIILVDKVTMLDD